MDPFPPPQPPPTKHVHHLTHPAHKESTNPHPTTHRHDVTHHSAGETATLVPTMSGKRSDLALHYSFEHVNEEEILDESGNDNNGQLTNGERCGGTSCTKPVAVFLDLFGPPLVGCFVLALFSQIKLQLRPAWAIDPQNTLIFLKNFRGHLHSRIFSQPL